MTLSYNLRMSTGKNMRCRKLTEKQKRVKSMNNRQVDADTGCGRKITAFLLAKIGVY